MESSLRGENWVHREYDWDDIEPAVALIELLAELDQDETTESPPVLDHPLHSYVDPDALNALVRSGNTTVVTLQIDHYHVRIHGNTVGVSTIERNQ